MKTFLIAVLAVSAVAVGVRALEEHRLFVAVGDSFAFIGDVDPGVTFVS